jgi:ectoine hydroxylase-related dioxygenase (phytanoyl-CoA dioxygenase family)
VAALIGPGFTWVASEANRYNGDSGWHPDSSYERDDSTHGVTWNVHVNRIKIGLYLDPVTAATGCLRVIPGSHGPAFHEQMKPLRRLRDDPTDPPFGVETATVPAHPIETEPGDVIFFHQNLWHAALGGGADRRHMAISMLEDLSTDAHVEYLRIAYQGTVEGARRHQYGFTGELYGDAFLNGESPRIQAMVARLKELGLR